MADNPFAYSNGVNGLTQRRLGPVWNKVTALYDNLANITKLADNMQAVREAANNISRGILSIEEMALAPGNTTFIDWPVALDINDLLYYTVVIVDTNGVIYTEASGHFDTLIQNGALEVIVDAGAPAAIENGIIRWTIDYKN